MNIYQNHQVKQHSDQTSITLCGFSFLKWKSNIVSMTPIIRNSKRICDQSSFRGPSHLFTKTDERSSTESQNIQQPLYFSSQNTHGFTTSIINTNQSIKSQTLNNSKVLQRRLQQFKTDRKYQCNNNKHPKKISVTHYLKSSNRVPHINSKNTLSNIEINSQPIQEKRLSKIPKKDQTLSLQQKILKNAFNLQLIKKVISIQQSNAEDQSKVQWRVGKHRNIENLV